MQLFSAGFFHLAVLRICPFWSLQCLSAVPPSLGTSWLWNETSTHCFGITVLKFIIVLWAGFLSSCWALEMDCLSVKIHILWCCKFFLTIMLSPQQNLLSLNVSKWWSCACFSKHEIEHFKNLLEEQWIMVFYVDWQHKEKSHFLQKYISFSTPLSQWRYYL